MILQNWRVRVETRSPKRGNVLTNNKIVASSRHGESPYPNLLTFRSRRLEKAWTVSLDGIFGSEDRTEFGRLNFEQSSLLEVC